MLLLSQYMGPTVRFEVQALEHLIPAVASKGRRKTLRTGRGRGPGGIWVKDNEKATWRQGAFSTAGGPRGSAVFLSSRGHADSHGFIPQSSKAIVAWFAGL